MSVLHPPPQKSAKEQTKTLLSIRTKWLAPLKSISDTSFGVTKDLASSSTNPPAY